MSTVQHVATAGRRVQTGLVRVIPGGNPRTSVLLTGQDFHLDIPDLDEEGNVGPNGARPTRVGSQLSTHSLWGVAAAWGSIGVDGVWWPRLSFGGPLEFEGAPVVLTQHMLDHGLHHHVTFTGRLKGYLNSAFIPDPPDPSVSIELTGSATLLVTFVRDTPGSDLYNANTIEYWLD